MSKEISMIDIRNGMYEAVKKKFGAKSATGSGGMVCPPFCMDFDFIVNDIVYRVDFRNMTCENCLDGHDGNCPEKNCPLGYDFSARSSEPLAEDIFKNASADVS